MSIAKITDNLSKGVDVNIQSQTEPLFQYFLMKELKTDITLTGAVDVDDTVINVSAGHGFTAATDEMIVLMEGNYISQHMVSSVSTNAITIVGLIDLPYTTDAKVIRGNRDLARTGTLGTPEEAVFQFYDGVSSNTVPIDISTVVMHMTHTAAADDSLFGDLTALVNPSYFRKINGTIQNLGFYKNNGDFRNYGAIVEYTDKAGGGLYSTNVTFNIIDIFTKEIRLDAADGDKVVFYNPGILAGLTNFYISILGSLTTGE